MRSIVGILAICLISSALAFQPPDSYACDKSKCKLPNCYCASQNPPIPVAETPQFILLTNDDAVDSKVSREMAKLTSSAKNTNGCPIPATWFTLTAGSSCDVINKLHKRGDELSTHTSTHKELALNVPKEQVQAEILGGRDYVIKECGVPAADVTGFRSPYLTTNPTVRQVLNESRFKYDSSMVFDLKGDGVLGNRSWPFTMDYGLAKDNCDGKFQVCDPSESYPGVWQVPLWDLQFEGQTYTMDPGDSSPGNGGARSAYDVLKTAFDASYAGNRAPIPIFVHVFWFSPERVNQTTAFIKYALTKPDTYFVTMQQMLEWMENPVPKAQMPLWLQQRCGGITNVVKPVVAQGPRGPLSWDVESTVFRPAIFGRRLLKSHRQ